MGKKHEPMNLLGESKDEMLKRVLAERDALARHIEKLTAPATIEEAQIIRDCFPEEHLDLSYLTTVLDEFLARRQREGQFAAFNTPLPGL